MSVENKNIIFVCSASLKILEVYSRNPDISAEELKNEKWNSILSPESYHKAELFAEEIINKSEVFNWELIFILRNKAESFLCSGIIHQNQLIIFCSQSSTDKNEIIQNMTSIENDLINDYRMITKEKEKLLKNSEIHDNYYHEFTAVNNDLVNIQRELNRKNIRLEELTKLKNNFIGMAAHDLRNPLSNINMIAELLIEDRDNLSEKHSEYIKHIVDLSNFMIQLISDLLDISVIESGTINLNLMEQDLIKQAEDAIFLNRHAADLKEIKINLEAEKESYICICDKEKIKQVIINFISNAVKYSPAKSEITIDIKEKKDAIILSVSDHGPGIKDEEQKALFSPFQMAGSVPTAGEKSSGLGLYIAKRIIEQHRGRIGLKSKYGEGAQFYFILPKNGKTLSA